jgi:hypothetical protein
MIVVLQYACGIEIFALTIFGVLFGYGTGKPPKPQSRKVGV